MKPDATAALSRLADFISMIAPVVASGEVGVFEAVQRMATQRGANAAEREALAREFIRDLARIDLVVTRLQRAESPHTVLRQNLEREAGPFNGPRENRQD